MTDSTDNPDTTKKNGSASTKTASPRFPVKTRIAAEIDPVGWLGSTAKVAAGAARNPMGIASAAENLASRLAKVPGDAARVALGRSDVDGAPELRGDRRFADKAWQENPVYFSLVQSYFAARAFTLDLVDAAEADRPTSAKARQFAELFWDAAAPTNTPITNPKVLTRAIESGGKSLARGAGYALSDLVRRKGRPQRVDSDAFTLGENMAATPGEVVFRNELIELIQYRPQTDEVHAVPMLASPPWINKYYIMDLGPGRSFLEWAVRHGRTVFVISYRNPDESMRSVTFDDYITDGIDAAIDAVQEITGAPTVDVVGLCLGGALASIAAALFAGRGDTRIGNLTLINTLLDYSEPGELGLLTDPDTLDKVEVLMAKKGYLPGTDMATTFDLMRANDLIFGYWVSRWMLGEAPPAFDLLVWNEDSTRMPAAMHTKYLRDLYGGNLLRKEQFEICGRTVSLRDFAGDVYIVGAETDHIVPWRSSYKGARLFGKDARYVLSNGGHIAGIVNPPSKKSWCKALGAPDAATLEALPDSAEGWAEKATRTDRTWWEDWAQWGSTRAGAMQAPPRMGSATHPPLVAAPGTYVHS
ncbi:PHA/PHB synthase family protein [Tomitella gaofuii]|uniref:PHA/PHB synthase family protein n=1 Tax=Tomitella gaofuii TaxID=2760083 RepID=UPI0015F98AF5|nr:alpha/beta fold hydrolase [Tomitella gaofuii]